jgi:MFS family permease
MGLGFITGAVGIPITGAIGDAIGLQNALMTQALLAAGTIGLAWFLPSEKEVDQLAAAGEAETSDRLALQLQEDLLRQ